MTVVLCGTDPEYILAVLVGELRTTVPAGIDVDAIGDAGPCAHLV